MLYADFIETDDKSVLLSINALKCLKKFRFHELREDIIEVAHNSSFNLELSCEVDSIEYDIHISPIGKESISVKVSDTNAASSDRVVICMNKDRILSLKSNHVDGSYTTVEWTIIVCKNNIMSNTDEIFDKSNLLEHRLQYDTVNPLAGLLLDFWGESE